MAAMKRPTLKISYNAPVSLTFALLALAALILGNVTDGWTTVHLFSVYRCSLADPLAWFRFVGHVLLAILFTALVSGVIQFDFFPSTALLGASGIVFMMILLSSFGGVRNGVIPTTLILVAVFYLGGELWDAIFVDDNVSQLTHIVGGLCGTFLGFALSGKKRR